MKKLKNRFIFWFLNAMTIAVIPLFAACNQNGSDQIVFGNYQSYMSPWLTNNLSNKYKASFDYFNVGEEVVSRYKVNSYDASIVSSSILQTMINSTEGENHSSLVKKINWEKFNIKDEKNKLIKSADEALSLYTKPVQEILTNTYKDNQGRKINLLNYGIPYFLQTFNFAYRGPLIPVLKNDISWNSMLNIIGHEARFKSRPNSPKIAMVQDPRTILSASEIIKGVQKGVNPDPKKISIDDLTKSYNNFVDNGLNVSNLGSNPVLLNSDSNAIVSKLAAKIGTISSSVGAFMYNGDVLYASNGGDENFNISGDDLHIVKNDNTLYALDLINFSSYTTNDKLDRLYKLTRSLSFEGLNDSNSAGMLSETEVDPSLNKNSTQKSLIESLTSAKCNTTECYSYDSNLNENPADGSSNYKYGPAINFNSVQYTPVLKKLYNELLGIPKNDQKCDPTFSDAEKHIEDSYFYESPQKVYFGKKFSEKSVDISAINFQNWKDFLSYANFNGENKDKNKTPTSEIFITNINHNSSNNQIEVEYQIKNLKDNSFSEKILVRCNLSNTAEQNFQKAKSNALSKAKLQEKIMIINSRSNMNNYVEQKLSDLAQSNMLIAFTELKSQW